MRPEGASDTMMRTLLSVLEQDDVHIVMDSLQKQFTLVVHDLFLLCCP